MEQGGDNFIDARQPCLKMEPGFRVPARETVFPVRTLLAAAPGGQGERPRPVINSGEG